MRSFAGNAEHCPLVPVAASCETGRSAERKASQHACMSTRGPPVPVQRHFGATTLHMPPGFFGLNNWANSGSPVQEPYRQTVACWNVDQIPVSVHRLSRPPRLTVTKLLGFINPH